MHAVSLAFLQRAATRTDCIQSNFQGRSLDVQEGGDEVAAPAPAPAMHAVIAMLE